MSWRFLSFTTRREALLATVALLLFVVALTLIAPQAHAFAQTPLPLAVAAAGVAYLSQCRSSDAVLFGLVILSADLVELLVGPQMLACLVLVPLAATGRPRFSLFLGGGVFLLLIASIKLKHKFAGTLLTVQDIYYFFRQFRDNVDVLVTQPTLVTYGVLALLLLTLPAVWLWRRDAPRGRQQRRAVHLTAMTLAVFLVVWSGHEAAQAATKERDRGAWLLSETIYGSAPLTRFLATGFLEPTVTVRRTDAEPLRRQMERVRAAYQARPSPSDIVVFLQESQFNPATIDGCPDELCRLSAFDTGHATVASGPMRVHVYGGGTWLTEFTLASGVPHTIFGAAGDFASYNVAPTMRRSFVRSLRDAGYRTVAVYPVRGGMMNARAAYAGYGFDRFYDASDLGLPDRFSTPDADIHMAALRVLDQERKTGRPVFLLALTIFNHSEHGVHLARVPSSLRDEATRYFADKSTAQNVADYVWRSREFQRTMDHTARRLLTPGRPAVLAWFGDHQPPFSGAKDLPGRIRPYQERQRFPSKYQTWYAVAANGASHKDPHRSGALDIAFLSGVLAQAAGAQLDDWLTANVAARQLCRGLLDECAMPTARDAYLSYLVHDLKSFDLAASAEAVVKTTGK